MSLRYVSTRGQASALSFADAVLAGLAEDGGLYVPEHVPVLAPEEICGLASLPYPALAARIMHPFMGGLLSLEKLHALLKETYAPFRHAAVAPLAQIGHDEFLLELFHGPTLAFKDFALQFLGRLVELLLKDSGDRLTVIGATSGDTGSAAIAGFAGRANANIFILHPKGKVSAVQRRQMTTVADANVHNIALKGNFDDCQDIVKALFADAGFRARHRLLAVNSINWARILAQVPYYFYAALALGAPGRTVSFCVPTGNFGDIYAGYVARRMGLPIDRLIIATNKNDILSRCLTTGIYGTASVSPTLSPSMDIQVSSNFERLLFDLLGRDGAAVAKQMAALRGDGAMALPAHALHALRREFDAGSADDEETLAAIAAVHRETRQLIDPHTAVGVAVGRRERTDSPLVTLATAHPAKFPAAVKQAAGIKAALPLHLADLAKREERYTILPARVDAVRQFIDERTP